MVTLENLTDEDFLKRGYEKRAIVGAIKAVCPKNWHWQIIHEKPDRIVIDVRRIEI